MLSMENIHKTKNTKCCKDNCLKNMLTLKDIAEARAGFWEKDREEQGQWLIHFFSFARKITNGRSRLSYIINEQREVCQKAWILCHGLSYGR